MSTPKPIIIVQGGQWGSEGKGMVAAALCERRDVRWAVRTGAVNAGHTVYKAGVKYVNQQLPTGWVYPGTNLVLGPGAYVNPDILAHEIAMLVGAGWDGCVFIDGRAGLHLDVHTERSKASGRHYTVGATGKGCSEAILDRIRLRGTPEARLFKDWMAERWEEDWMEKVIMGDSVKLLNDAYDRGEQILLEGTQGTLLDLYLGPYPYTTHKQCTAAQWVVEAGLSPSLEYEVVLVARTYPIRVAGNSGPMAEEIDWPLLSREIDQKLMRAGKPGIIDFTVSPNAVKLYEAQYAALEGTYASDLVEKSCRASDALAALPDGVQAELRKLWEFTTVTKKLRRIARLNLDDLRYSVMVNRPAWICLTFVNYQFPECWGWTAPVNNRPPEGFIQYLDGIERATGCDIRAFTTGPESEHFHYTSR